MIAIAAWIGRYRISRRRRQIASAPAPKIEVATLMTDGSTVWLVDLSSR